LDGTEIAIGTANGTTNSPQYWGLNFGAIWNKTGFEGLIDDVYVDDHYSPPTPPAPPQLRRRSTQFHSIFPARRRLLV
jgi:hypothetical protein